jgi:hypothetical protein
LRSRAGDGGPTRPIKRSKRLGRNDAISTVEQQSALDPVDRTDAESTALPMTAHEV